MPQPLVASHRLDFQYTIAGVTHHRREYVATTTSGTDPLGYALLTRAGQPDRDVQDAVNDYWTALRGMYTVAQTSFDQVRLEVFSAGAWNPLGIYNSSVVPNGTGTEVAAGQATITLRDTSFFKARVILMESLCAIGKKTQNRLAAVSPSQTFVNAVSASGGGGTPTPNDWILSRGARHLSLSPFVGEVTDLNDKIRRRRGLQ